jgi:hypothetical protein
MYVCVYVCMYACMHACMYVFLYVCMYVFLYVCMLYIYVPLNCFTGLYNHDQSAERSYFSW